MKETLGSVSISTKLERIAKMAKSMPSSHRFTVRDPFGPEAPRIIAAWSVSLGISECNAILDSRRRGLSLVRTQFASHC